MAADRRDPQREGGRGRRRGRRCGGGSVPAARRDHAGPDLRVRAARAGHAPGCADVDGRDHSHDRDRVRRPDAGRDRCADGGDRPGGVHRPGADPAVGAPPRDAGNPYRLGTNRGPRAEPRAARVARDDGRGAGARTEQPGGGRAPRLLRSGRGARRPRLDGRRVRRVRDRARSGRGARGDATRGARSRRVAKCARRARCGRRRGCAAGFARTARGERAVAADRAARGSRHRRGVARPARGGRRTRIERRGGVDRGQPDDAGAGVSRSPNRRTVWASS